jgi:hypothetical protein
MKKNIKKTKNRFFFFCKSASYSFLFLWMQQGDETCTNISDSAIRQTHVSLLLPRKIPEQISSC